MEDKIVKVLKKKVESFEGDIEMPVLRGKPIEFWESADGTGLEVYQLNEFILKWEHFSAIVKKANKLGGKMYRGDNLVMMKGAKLGEDISHDCMEGFIASTILGTIDGTSVTRRSTYYSGILAWAEIVTLHKSQGKGSYITVNKEYRE